MGFLRRSVPTLTLRSTSAGEWPRGTASEGFTSQKEYHEAQVEPSFSVCPPPLLGPSGFRYGFLCKRLAQYPAVASGERDSAKRRKCRSDVRGRDAAKIFASLDSPPHPQNRHALIIVVRSSMAGAVVTRFSRWTRADDPVWLRHHQ